MDTVRGRRARRRSFKERLGFKTMSCCGAAWDFRSRDDDLDDHRGDQNDRTGQNTPRTTNISDPVCAGQSPASPGMNLAAALAAERHFRATHEPERYMEEGSRTVPGTPLRMSLMRLLQEADGGDVEASGAGGEVSETVCCVCMARKKGAAFIPCGHTLCRVCSRELWLNRGSCPLCNRSILEILDIF